MGKIRVLILWFIYVAHNNIFISKYGKVFSYYARRRYLLG